MDTIADIYLSLSILYLYVYLFADPILYIR